GAFPFKGPVWTGQGGNFLSVKEAMPRILQKRLGWFPRGVGLVVVVDDLGVLEEIHNLKERALTTKFLNPASNLGEAFLTSLQRKVLSRDVWQGFL
ncbi:hypothetical protein PJP10_31640, partial [Mycobacterium kansasii]